jgi:uncharacterized protein YjbI with pentapeptide repeats
MSDEQPTKKRPWWLWPAVILGTPAFIVLLIWGPWWIEGHHIEDGGKLVSSGGIVVTGFRTTLVAIAAGIFTWANLVLSRKKHDLERQQFAESQKQFETTLRETQARDAQQAELTREGQVTDRYVEAVKLLGNANQHQRVGGIYALERILKDSEADRPAIVDVLSVFARTGPGSQVVDDAPSKGRIRRQVERPPGQSGTADVQAAVTVLGRWPQTHDGDLDLSRADLRGLNFLKAELCGANMSASQLDGALLAEANLSDGHFLGAKLRLAWMTSAVARNADFTDADLSRSTLQQVDLEGARLHRANLSHANLWEANLRQTDLTSVCLDGASLRGTDLSGAVIHPSSMQGAGFGDVTLARAQIIGDWREAADLTVEQLLTAFISENAQLPREIAKDRRIQARMRTPPAAHG